MLYDVVPCVFFLQMNSVGNLQLAFLPREEDELPLEPIFDIGINKINDFIIIIIIIIIFADGE